MKRSDTVKTAASSNGAVLLDVERGVMFDVNATGAVLWAELDGRSSEQLIGAMQEKYPTVPADALARDVLSFLNQVTARGLIVM
jgi:hypothetical protein